MNLQALLCGVDILSCKDADLSHEISVISHRADTRFSGGLYIALRGLKKDGNAFLQDACMHGARYAISDREVSCDGLCVIYVRDARIAMARIWSNYYRNPAKELCMIGITGTNGKTSSACMIEAILRHAGKRVQSIGTLNGSMTTPDPEELYRRLRDMADGGVEYAVMEASSHALRLGKLDPIHFHSAVFTNLTPEHLDFHNNMEDYYQSKAILFSQCERGYFNYDDLSGRRLYSEAACEKYYYSKDNANAHFHVANIKNYASDGVEYHLFCRNMLFRVRCPIPGEFTVYNTMAASAVCLGLGISQRDIRSALQKMHTVQGRMQKLDLPMCDFSVFVDFAHTPDALQKVLSNARQWMHKGQRLVVLFGCGGDRDRQKRPVMGEIATRYADLCYITSDNPRSEDPAAIIRDILRGVSHKTNYTVIQDRKTAITHCILHARENDVIVLAGKGHEAYEITNQGKFPFSEEEIVRAAMEARDR